MGYVEGQTYQFPFFSLVVVFLVIDNMDMS